jgi:photosystem II stability/assembly factor-like uncharacterized protein
LYCNKLILLRHLTMNKNPLMKILLTLILSLFSTVTVNAQWTAAGKADTPGDLNTVYFADSKRGWVGGDNGYLAWTNDGGVNWVQLNVGTKNSISDVYFRGSDKGYLLAGDKVFSSTDGGQTWREDKILLRDDIAEGEPELYSLRFANKKNGWIVGSVNKKDAVVGSLVLHTRDGGTLWRRVRIPTNVELIHVDFVDEDNGWIVGANGTILATTDGGENWRFQSSGTTSTLFHIDFKNKNLGWAVGGKGLILRTEDGGATWNKISSGVDKTLLSVEFINERNGWAIGHGGTILRSDDGGATWIQQEGKTRDSLYALYIDKKTGWVVGKKGMILRYER